MTRSITTDGRTIDSDQITVLHVDDNPGFTEMTQKLLERENDSIEPITAQKPSAGLDILSETDVDCVVTDYEMPGMNGIEFLEAIREEYPDLPVILFTGKGSEDVAAKAIDAGVTSYLQKESGAAQYCQLAHRVRSHVEAAREKRRAERLEREHELVAETASDAFWTRDVATGAVSFSDGLRRFGYDPAAIDADVEWWFERVHPDDREEQERIMRALLQREDWVFDELRDSRGRFSKEYRWERADGSYATVASRGSVLYDGTEAVQVVGTMTDITAERERERELEAVRERLELALETTDAVVWEVESESGEITFNPSSETLCGSLIETMDDLLETVHPDDRERVEEAIHTAHETGTYDVNFRVTSEGETRWITSMGRFNFDADGDPVRGIGIARDITARKEHERELARQNERLEEFASIVSHDLRAPLSVVRGNLELVAQDHDSEELDAALDRLAHAEQILEDTLRLAREGQVVGETEEVELRELAAESRRNVETSDIEITADISLRADRRRLKRLLENLFQNAVDHAGDDATVRVGHLTDGFYVEDDGSGVPDADREKILERGHSTDGGTGFGMNIVEQIADAHGWDTRITESAAGGLRVEFTGVDLVR
ncbi:MAG: PAS domain-containing protein [Halolamina sp.]